MILNSTSQKKVHVSLHRSRKTSQSSGSRPSKKNQSFRLQHVALRSRRSISYLPRTRRSIFPPEFKTRPFVKRPELPAARRVSAGVIKRRVNRRQKRPRNGSGGIRR